LLQLYNKNKEKINGLRNYKDYCIESVLSTGDRTLSFSYPAKLSHGIEEEGYIITKTNEFVIKEIQDSGDYKSIKAVLNVEDLEGKVWDRFVSTEETIADCLALALAGTSWLVGTCNITKKRTIVKTCSNTWEIIQEAQKTYRVELEFDTLNKRINVNDRVGTDKGCYFIDSLNLKALDIQSNSYDYYTRIISEGKDGLLLADPGYLENYQYSNKIKTLYWKDERYTNLESLTEDAAAKLEEMSKPYRSYTATILDLASMNEIYKDILSYSLGDVITLISKEKSIKEKQRIVKIIEYPDEPTRNTCEISNTKLSFDDIQKQQQETTDIVNNITEDDGTVSESAISTAVAHLVADKADIQDLNVISARIGTLEVNRATIDQLNATNATIVTLLAADATINSILINKANIADLNATNANISSLDATVANIKTLISGNLTSANIQSLVLTSSKVTVDNGFIKNAMIESLDVTKINAGTINTNKISVSSADGGLVIAGATQQFKDKNNNVRLQLGQDATGNFNFILRAQDGTTTLIDGYGIKENAIADGLIKTDMVADEAVTRDKINYSSFITGFNADTNTDYIKASKVAIDLEGQSLDVAFNNISTTVEDINSKKMYRVEIISSSGNIFKNGDISTVLSARVYSWDEDITDAIDANKFRWTRVSNDTNSDNAWNTAHFGGTKQITVTQNDVYVKATFDCEILE
jgi:phage minor structural protein